MTCHHIQFRNFGVERKLITLDYKVHGRIVGPVLENCSSRVITNRELWEQQEIVKRPALFPKSK